MANIFWSTPPDLKKYEMCLELSEMARTLIQKFEFVFAPHDDDVEDDDNDYDVTALRLFCLF
jgi:hypothetical protein